MNYPKIIAKEFFIKTLLRMQQRTLKNNASIPDSQLLIASNKRIYRFKAINKSLLKFKPTLNIS